MSTPPSQPTIYEPSDAQYGLFYWIYLNNHAQREEITVQIAKSCARIHQTSQNVHNPTGLKVAVGFGKNFLKEIEYKFGGKISVIDQLNKPREDQYVKTNVPTNNYRKHLSDWKQNMKIKMIKEQNWQAPEMKDYPSNGSGKIHDTGGDIFVHAKGNSIETLNEFKHLFMNTLPPKCVDKSKTNDTFGFTHEHHRDLSGYMIGTSNPVTSEERRTAAVTQHGGSFAITQKWKHNMKTSVERPEKDKDVDEQDEWIGCRRETGKVLEENEMKKNAHVWLMKQVKTKIVRQSLPIVKVKDMQICKNDVKCASRLFFLAYAKTPSTFDEMLTTMDKDNDQIFQMSTLECGTYWYFPGMTELDNLYLDDFNENYVCSTLVTNTPPSQPTVCEPSDAQYALFCWIHFKDELTADSDITNIAKQCALIHTTARRVNDSSGLQVGVGYGKKFLKVFEDKLTSIDTTKLERDKTLNRREKRLIENAMLKAKPKPSEKLNYPIVNNFHIPNDAGGDIFVHAKGNSIDTLYEFRERFMRTLPVHLIDICNVTLGFSYKHHRDTSGYMLGTANPVTVDERRIAAVQRKTGGSFAITQKWEHKRNIIRVERPSNEIVKKQDSYIGQKRESGNILAPNLAFRNAHVQLMRTVKHKILRQSLPYDEGNATGKFFLAYASDTAPFNEMLQKMATQDKIFEMSSVKRGTYWYFPGLLELDNLCYYNEF